MKIGHSEPAGEESGVGNVVAHMQYEDNPPMERAHHPRPFGCGLRVTSEGKGDAGCFSSSVVAVATGMANWYEKLSL